MTDLFLLRLGVVGAPGRILFRFGVRGKLSGMLGAGVVSRDTGRDCALESTRLADDDDLRSIGGGIGTSVHPKSEVSMEEEERVRVSVLAGG